MTMDDLMQQIEETERLIAVYRNANEVNLLSLWHESLGATGSCSTHWSVCSEPVAIVDVSLQSLIAMTRRGASSPIALAMQDWGR
jgi:hypothetical protein